MRQRNGRKLLDVILDVLCLISAVCLNESNMPHQYMLQAAVQVNIIY
jgi:hypothetical protein